MLRIILTAFLALPIQRFQVANNDFVDYLTNLTPLLLLIPTMTRHNEICQTDDDCPLIMRCCEIGQDKYCCTPNNFVKMSYAFQNQEIQHHKNQKGKENID